MRLDQATQVIPFGIAMGVLRHRPQRHHQRLARGAVPGPARRDRRLPGRADERAAAAPRRQPDGRRPLDRGAELQRAGLHPRPRRVLHRHDALRPVGVHLDRRLRRARRRHDVADPPLAPASTASTTAARSSTCSRSRAATSIDAAADPRRARSALRRPLALVVNALRLGHLVVAAAPAAGRRACIRSGRRRSIFTLASLAIVAARPRALGQVLRTPALWLLVAAAGITNAAFNWAIVIGDVVRVVLLFYLMPLWTVLLARAGPRRAADRRGGAAHRARRWRRGDRALAGRPATPPAGLAARCRCRARSPTGSASSAASRSRSTT